jgi:glycosyltransferase involved in cell wall biosynthesis
MSTVLRVPPREYDWIADVDDARAHPRTDSRVVPGSISACLVVRQEETTIARCLRSLADVVDEIIVVHDGPCVDRTMEMAAEAGCQVFVQPAYGGCEHHLPFAYEHATGDWLLTIDADECLSDALRAGLRELTRASDVDGYEFLWPLWDGRRYITRAGPYKLALVRRAAFRMVGIVHSKGEVDGAISRVPLLLEHRPPYDNFGFSAIATKWRARARLQAIEYVSDLNTAPRFNCPGRVAWTSRRLWTNRWAPLLVLPAGLHTFVHVMRQLSGELSLIPRVRFAWTQGVYRSMVTAHVAVEQLRRVSTRSS